MKKIFGKFCVICLIILFLIPDLSGSSKEKKYVICFSKYTGPFSTEMVNVLIQKLSLSNLVEIVDEGRSYKSPPKIDHYIFVQITNYETTITNKVEFIASVNLQIIEANTGLVKKTILKEGKMVVAHKLMVSEKMELHLSLIDKIGLGLQNYYQGITDFEKLPER